MSKSLIYTTLVFIFALLVCVFVFCNNIRDRHNFSIHASRLSEITSSLKHYDSIKGSLPGAQYRNHTGQLCCSWRLLVMEFLVQAPGCDIDQPWNTGPNKSYSPNGVRWFCYEYLVDEPANPRADISVAIGDGTPFQMTSSMPMSKVDDETILIFQRRGVAPNWMAPGDTSIDQIDSSLFKGMEGNGILVGFADNQVWEIAPNVPVETFKIFLLPTRPIGISREKMLRKYCRRVWFEN